MVVEVRAKRASTVVEVRAKRASKPPDPQDPDTPADRSAVSINIQATPASPAPAGRSTGAVVGSDLQRALQAATKDLREAQQKLAKDVAAQASEDTIKADQLAVQLAQAAVAQAAAAIAKANAEAQQKKAETEAPERPPATSPATSSASSPNNPVDLYA
jgi:hypothetical protein